MKVHENEIYQGLIDEIEALACETADEASLLQKIEELETLAADLHDPVLNAVVTYHKGDIPYKYANFEECRKYTEMTLQICQEIDFTYYIMRCYNTLAVIDSEKADYYSSISNYLKAFYIADGHPEYQYGCILLNNIGNLFVWLYEHEMALDYLIQAYNRYFLENVNSAFKIGTIVVNIIEEYSINKDYQNAEKWINVDIPYCKEIDDVIQLISTINRIDQLYQSGNLTELPDLVAWVLENSSDNNNFIYIFRSYIRLLDYAIDANDRMTANLAIEHMEQMNKNSAIYTFQYDYILLKYRYYVKFEKDNDLNSTAKHLLEDYITTSDHVVREMRNTYTRRLTIETQLLKVQQEKENSLRRTQQLQKDIELDYFTKIFNKISMEKYVQLSIDARKANTTQALLLVDIDFFKEVNDNYGHERGDELILSVVHMISSHCGDNMLFGRFGGDEFIIFLTDIPYGGIAGVFADELLSKARKIYITDTKYITLSIGMHILEDGDDFKTAFQKADKALYTTKANGRNGYFVYNDQNLCSKPPCTFEN